MYGMSLSRHLEFQQSVCPSIHRIYVIVLARMYCSGNTVLCIDASCFVATTVLPVVCWVFPSSSKNLQSHFYHRFLVVQLYITNLSSSGFSFRKTNAQAE